jgi:GNAT superfamily N-acetyltransferase
MIKLIRTNSDHPDFQKLVALLDADLKIRDGEDHAFYAQFNTIAAIRHVILAFEAEKPVGCGAFREHQTGAVEIKRMFVRPEHRGKGIASQILGELEHWAKELSYNTCILETGKNQPEAIALYQKHSYALIPNYGPYQQVGNSVCFQKKIH